MKFLLIFATVWVISSTNTVNYCGQNSCCSTYACNSCANNCRYQCQSETCTNSCINNCIQTIPQTCSGGTCNICSESQCCNSQSCNTCANTCAAQCTTQFCKSDCVNRCIQTPSTCAGGNCNASPSCVGQNCNNVCVGGQCCNNQDCNTCVNQCYNQRSGCTRSCVKDCIQPEPIKIDIPIPDRDCNNLQFQKDSKSEETSDQTSEVKTIVDLNNIINNTNRIYVPIRINNTNINNVHYPKRSKDVKPPVSPEIEIFVSTEKPPTKAGNLTEDGCCYVLHPRECFNTPTGPKCQRRRHRECSAICTSDVVVISPVTAEQTPYPPSQCHYVQQYPYVYCGNYQKHNCGNCYGCAQGLPQQQCASRSECSPVCRNNLW